MFTVIEDAFAEPCDWSALGLRVAARWDEPPARDAIRSALSNLDDDGLVVSGTAATLNVVVEGLRRAGRVTEIPIAYLAGVPRGGRDSHDLRQSATLDLVDQLSLPDLATALTAPPTRLPLARSEVGGVLLVEARLTPASTRAFGAQAFHDDEMVADGEIRELSIRPDYSATNVLLASASPTSGRRRPRTTTGRAVQIACDPVLVDVDGRQLGEITGRTWYLDDREHWLLRGAQPPAPRAVGSPADGRRRSLRDLLRRRTDQGSA